MIGKLMGFQNISYICNIIHNRTYNMATLILQVPDESLVSKVRQACKMLVGVTSVKVQKEKKTKKRDITK